MASERYVHLELSRLTPTPPRRKGGGGGEPLKKYTNVRQHGDHIKKQLDVAERALIQAKPDQFDPGLLVRLKIQPGTLSESALKAFGIDVVSEESDETLVVFFNDQAKKEFIARLERYQLGQSGHGVSSNVFHAIEEIGKWGRKNRIGRTLRKKTWSAKDQLTVDIELWPRDSKRLNDRECEQTVSWFKSKNAEVWDQLSTKSVVLIRVQLTGAVLDQALELETIRIVERPPELYLEPSEYDSQLKDFVVEGPDHENGATIAILDGGVVSGHPMLAKAMGDEVSFVADRTLTVQTGHGSAVAGFALYGDVEKCVKEKHFSTSLRLLSGIVLAGEHDNYDRRLIANQVIEAVTYFHDEYQCRVFNISFGDSLQPYDGRHVRGLATVLDELAREKDIIFVVSAGNFCGSPDSKVPKDWRAEYPHYLHSPEAKIIDPAPALNAITVGSLARYDADQKSIRFPRDVNLQPIARAGEISPFSRTGPGPNGAIKPDLVEYGGNLSVDLRGGGEPRFTRIDPNIGEMALKHQFVGDRLFVPMIGTSFAAPKVSNIAARLLGEYPDASANLVRALLVLNAKWPSPIKDKYEEDEDVDMVRDYCGYGYGVADVDRTLYSIDTCVTLISEQVIAANQTHFFEIPLPEDFLANGRCDRSIRVALAHCPPCRSTRKVYKGSKMSFKIVCDDDVETLAARFSEGSDLDNISEWTGVTPGGRLRGKGSVMAAGKRLHRIASNFPLKNGKRLFIVVTHQVEEWAAGVVSPEEKYAVAVALEEHANNEVQLYAQLRARLRQRARARVGS